VFDQALGNAIKHKECKYCSFFLHCSKIMSAWLSGKKCWSQWV